MPLFEFEYREKKASDPIAKFYGNLLRGRQSENSGKNSFC